MSLKMQNLKELHTAEAEDQDLEKNSTKVEKFREFFGISTKRLPRELQRSRQSSSQ